MKKKHICIIAILLAASPYTMVYNYYLKKCKPSYGQIYFSTQDTVLYNTKTKNVLSRKQKAYRQRSFFQQNYKEIISYLLNSIDIKKSGLIIIGTEGILFLYIDAHQTDCEPDPKQILLSYITQETYPNLTDEFLNRCPSNFLSKTYEIITNKKYQETPLQKASENINTIFAQENYVVYGKDTLLQSIANIALWTQTHRCLDPFLRNTYERIIHDTSQTFSIIGQPIGVIAIAEKEYAFCIEPSKKLEASSILLKRLALQELSPLSALEQKIGKFHKNRTRLDIEDSAW